MAPAMGHQDFTMTIGNEAGTSVWMSHQAPKLMTMPRTVPPMPSSTDSIRMMPRMNALDAPSDFRMPISRVRCSTAMYMERQTTANPMITAMDMMTTRKPRSAGTLFTFSSDAKSSIE